MSVASIIASPTLTQRRLATLDQWAEAGMALAQSLVSGRGFADAGRVFRRIAQAVRLATLLALRLCDPTNPAYQPTPAKTRAARAAGSETPPENERLENEPLQSEPVKKPERERQADSGDREISDDAILRRPLVEIVKVICRALGVKPDWSLWTDEVETSAAPPPCPDAAPAPPPAPPNPRRAIPEPPPRRSLIIDRPELPPPDRSPRARLLSACAPGALCPVIPPIVVPTIGRPRSPEA